MTTTEPTRTTTPAPWYADGVLDDDPSNRVCPMMRRLAARDRASEPDEFDRFAAVVWEWLGNESYCALLCHAPGVLVVAWDGWLAALGYHRDADGTRRRPEMVPALGTDTGKDEGR